MRTDSISAWLERTRWCSAALAFGWAAAPALSRATSSQWATIMRPARAAPAKSSRRTSRSPWPAMPVEPPRKHLKAGVKGAMASSSARESGSRLARQPKSTRELAATWARRSSRAARLVLRGGLFWTSTTLVTPPCRAPAEPRSQPSFQARPGSRKCTCTSTRPGITDRPWPSRTGVPAGGARHAPPGAPRASMTPLRTLMSTSSPAGHRRAPRRKRFAPRAGSFTLPRPQVCRPRVCRFRVCRFRVRWFQLGCGARRRLSCRPRRSRR